MKLFVLEGACSCTTNNGLLVVAESNCAFEYFFHVFFFFYFHDNFKPQRVDINDVQLCIQNISIVCLKKVNNDLLNNNNGKIGEDMDFFL